ncbi:MAG: electron transport complex subunit RsxC [Rikenellaceae bacterium]
MKSFSLGGIHPPENKLSHSVAITTANLPLKVNIPLAQHIGAPATAIVAKGDKVVTGQLIAQATGFMSANIHSSITGTVKAVAPQPNAQGLMTQMITIERAADDAEEWAEGIDLSPELVKECTLEPAAIIEKIKAGGIVGMGGATFPTQVKLSIPPTKKADVLVINGVECEPYLTSDHRAMLQRTEEIVVGVSIVMRAIGVKKAYIGIENNKRDAIELMQKVAANYKGIEVTPLKVKYPQGGEKQLIEAVTGRQVPPPPALPIDVGAVVVNVFTALAIYEAVQKNKPVVERVVTVSGKSVKNPINVMTRFGVATEEVIALAGGLPEDTMKVIGGGPMMGRAYVNLAAPITKGSSGITIINSKEGRRAAESACIKCGKCVAACPMALEPYLLSKLMKRSAMDTLEAHNVTDCIECGSCQFTCPAQLPLLDYIRLGKQRVMGIIRARAMAK